SRFSGFNCSAARIGVSSDVLVDATAGVSSGAPQSSQNFAVEEFCPPHLPQSLKSGLPHCGQNFLPDVLSVPHLAQRMSIAQFVEQRLGVFEVGGIEAFREPVVDFKEQCARLIVTMLPRQQPRKAGCGTQLPRFGLLAASEFERLLNAYLSFALDFRLSRL